MMKANPQNSSDKQIIATALKRAIDFMGIKTAQLAKTFNVSVSTLNRDFQNGIEPESLKGQVSLLVIRMYRSLSAISGNDDEFVRHFLNTDNNYFGQKPINVIKSMEGLVSVNPYLDAMRGKV